MKKIMKKTLCISLLVLISVPSQAMDGYVDQASRAINSKPGRIVIGGTVVCASAYALYKFFGWCLRETDQQIIDQAQNRFDASSRYNQLLHVLQNRLQMLSIPTKDAKTYLCSVDEDLLYQLAVAKHADVSVDQYLAQLDKDMRSIKESMTKLSERMPQVAEYTTRIAMQNLYDNLHTVLADLESLYAYVNQHISYFRLYESEAEIGPRYSYEMELLRQYQLDKNQQAQAIRLFVSAESKFSSNSFPRIQYRTAIDADIATLEKRSSSAGNYRQRLSAAQQLLASLKMARVHIITDIQYKPELTEYQQHKKELERLEIERRRMAAEERRAQAEQDRARAERDKAQAEKDRAKADRSRARTERRKVDHDRGRASNRGAEFLEDFFDLVP